MTIPPLPARLPRAEKLTEAGFFRIVRTKYRSSEPSFRKEAIYRFDSPDKSFGTLYCARDFKTCFLETVVRDRPTLRIPGNEYDSRSVVFLLLDTSQLDLVPLYGKAITQMRLDSADLLGKDYGFTQTLAKDIHDHPDAPDGMIYRARFDTDSLAIVLFDRAIPRVRLFPRSSPVKFKDARELCDAVRATVPFSLV